MLVAIPIIHCVEHGFALMNREYRAFGEHT